MFLRLTKTVLYISIFVGSAVLAYDEGKHWWSWLGIAIPWAWGILAAIVFKTFIRPKQNTPASKSSD